MVTGAPLLFGILATLLASTEAKADDNIVALQIGMPAEDQQLNIVTTDIKFYHMFWQWGESGCQLGLGGRGGMLKVGGESTARFGAGGRIECQWNNWFIWTSGEVIWLDQYQFGKRGNGFKNYGGPFQFTPGIGLGYAITNNWLIGYQYEHMSNASMYRPNPGLDSHLIYIEYRF